MGWKTGIQSQIQSFQGLKNGTWSRLPNIQHHMVRIKGKLEQSRERSCALSLHCRCINNWKEILRVALDFGRQLYLYIFKQDFTFGGARGVMVIVVGNGHGDTSSNHFCWMAYQLSWVIYCQSRPWRRTVVVQLYITHISGDERVFTFPKDINLQVNVKARLKFEHTTMSQFRTLPITPSGMYVFRQPQNSFQSLNAFSFSVKEISLPKWKITSHITSNRNCSLHICGKKFRIIWTRISQVLRLLNYILF